ncbi:MAG TPA: type II secretion system F family protein [Terriglobales bacterium]|nr:type II secretion system F family protein [Terriglobales bacterium]
MAEYLIKLADERGHIFERTEPGYSESEVRDRFMQQGYLVYWVRPQGLLTGGRVRVTRRRKVKLDQFVIFNQQFITLIKAGLPIVQGLDLLSRRQRNPFFRSLLENVRDRVRGGELLSDAFAEQGVFPRIYSTTIMAGEKSGNLEETLTRYVQFQKLSLAFRRKVLSSLIYPALLITGVFVLLGILVQFVIPRFNQLYKELDRPLPPLTTFTLSFLLGIKAYLPYVVLAVVAAVFLVWRWAQTEKGGTAIDRFKMNLVIFGDVWLKYQIAMFSRMLSTLLAGGLSLVPAMETASQSMQSRLIGKSVDGATQSVREGRSLARSLEETKVFPELAIEMIEVGESTGALPTMLNSVAEFYEDDVETALTRAMSLIEPTILIFMGLVVGFILLSLYMPVFSIGASGIGG